MIYTLPQESELSSDSAIFAALRMAQAAFEAEVVQPETLEALEAFRVRWFGDKAGLINKGIAGWVKLVSKEGKPEFGKAFGPFRSGSQVSFDRRKEQFDQIGELTSPSLDLSLPGLRRNIGVEHPLTRTMREMTAVFAALGYSVGVGPEVESDFYNFEALNFPPNHPARDTQDTLVVADQDKKSLRERLLMRTHTSPVQIRSMVANPPPLRIVIPGKVHRNDESDATHSPIFHQVEGLCVDTNITFSDLKGTLDYAMKAFFGSSVKTRFFPSFFPFTEPSADVQISCPFCGQKGCRKCKYSGWIELLGCGMVDPAVFAAVDARRIENGLDPLYDHKKISGFAFGMGVERIAMMKYGVGDIGQFYSGDLRFLSQFV
jgi:phenylalanyl-tRNA synthetase alpha chain